MNADALPVPPRVGVVTVSFGSERVLEQFLPSVAAASASPVALIVADNRPSDDGVIKGMVSAAGGAYLPIPSNPGYGGAVNRAVREMPESVEWVLVSNPDVALEPGSLDCLLSAAASDDSIGAVGPAILNEDGTVYPSARQVPSIGNGIGHALFANVWPGNRWSRAYLDAPASEGAVARDAGWLSGACVLVRRSVFEQLGGFDEGYFMYFEDVDLGYRIGQAGYRNRYEPAARVLHIGAHSTSGESAQMIDAHHRSAARFLARKYPAWWQWPVRVVLRSGLSVRSMVAKRRARAASFGWTQGA